MELLIQSIIVYGFIVFVMTNAGLYAYRHQYPNGFLGKNNLYNRKSSFLDLLTKSHFLIPILVFCLFATIRFQVGVDCESYKITFYSLLEGKYGRETMELGFLAITKFTTYFTNKHYLMFFIIAFMQIGALYYAVRKESYLLVFLGFTIFFTNTFLSLMNGMRQNITACMFVAITPLILNKKHWIWAIATTLLAITMHRSALAIIPIGLFGYLCRNNILNRYLQLAIVFVCLIYMDKLEGIIPAELFDLGAFSGYSEETIEHYSDYEIDLKKNFGFRSILLLITYIITILYSSKLKKFYSSIKFNYMYNLFFIGVCLSLLFYNNFTINRLLYFCDIFTPFVLSYLLFYLWSNRSINRHLILFITISLLLLHIMYQLYISMTRYPLEVTLYKFDI